MESEITVAPIIAQCTPQGSGALALIRISGEQALAVADTISKLGNKKTISNCKTHTIEYGWVIDDNQKHIDQVLFFIMHAPRTFTGENTVEITCHNNPFIIDAIIQQALKHGARMAEPGEFTKQAVLNEKIDLVQAEAVNELIHAHTQTALKKSLAQLEGSLSHWSADIERELLNALTLSEASFEFLDDESAFADQIKKSVDAIQQKIALLKKSFNQQKHIKEGIRIAIIGSVNAGKSSLFNAILGKKRAIVTSQAGTTRDTVEAGLYRYGTYMTLIDTAGLRETDDRIEQEGIERSWQEAAQADIILLTYDGSSPLSEKVTEIYTSLLEKYAQKILIIRNKNDLQKISDLPTKNTATELPFSCVTNKGIETIEDALKTKIMHLLNQNQTPFLINQRHYTSITTLEKKLTMIQDLFAKEVIAYELISYHLQEALTQSAELTGKTVHENVLSSIFSTFCVGK